MNNDKKLEICITRVNSQAGYTIELLKILILVGISGRFKPMTIGQHLQPSSFEKVQLKCEEGTTIIPYFIEILNLSAKYHTSYLLTCRIQIYM